MTNSSDDHSIWKDPFHFIGRIVLEPTLTYAGGVLNVLVFCVWMFGPKSKSLCCATYFTANAVADFLMLTIRPIYRERWIINIPYMRTDIACKLFWSLCNSVFQISTWLSATITVERTLTIVLPFVFKPQDMRRRSRYIVAIIYVIQPVTQILTLLYARGNSEAQVCYVDSQDKMSIINSIHVCLTIAIPFFVIITFNLATITALCRNRFRQNTVSGNRDHVHVFTKITIMTGVSFVVSYSIELIIGMYHIFDIEIDSFFWDLYSLNEGTMYFNSCINPIICLVVCKTMHDDMKSFLMAVIQSIWGVCAHRQSTQESQIASASHIAQTV